MSSTRSPSPTAPRTERPVLIVTHGAPSHPVSQEIAVRDLVYRMKALLPGVKVRGATLAAKTALGGVAAGLDDPVVCPWFMSDGWFVRTRLPECLRAAGLSRWRMADPLGLLPGLGRIMAERVSALAASHDWPADRMTIILAAHGSPSSDRPRLATEATARAMARHSAFRAILPCYVDEAPAIADVARVSGPAVVLPFFALRASHVTDDLPDALAEAGFDGPVLDPVGLWPEALELVAADIAALRRSRVA